MIPKILHFIWLGHNPIPDYGKFTIKIYQEVNPDFKINLINEADVYSSTNEDIVYTLKKIHSQPDYKNKQRHVFGFSQFHGCQYYPNEYPTVFNTAFSDALRITLLDKYGGIYLDLDTFPVKPFDDFLMNCKYFTSYNRFNWDNFLHPDTYFIGCDNTKAKFYHPNYKEFWSQKPTIVNYDDLDETAKAKKEELAKKFFGCEIKYGESFINLPSTYINHYNKWTRGDDIHAKKKKCGEKPLPIPTDWIKYDS